MDEIIHALYSGDYNLNGTQFRIILCIFYNNDYGKVQGAELSLRNIAREINGHRIMVRRELNKLFDLNIIKIIEEYSSEDRCGRIISLNPVNKWVKNRNVI